MPMSIPGPTSANPASALAPAASAPPTADTAAPAPAAAAVTPSAEGEQRRTTAGNGPDRRLSRTDRRAGLDRRQATAEESGYTGPERRTGERRDTTGLERRRGPGRRRSDDRKAAEEGEMTGEQFEFVMAIETYKRVNKRMYPTWTEILEVVRQLGYRKVEARKIKLDAPEPDLHQG